jgi:hypothetical protein
MAAEPINVFSHKIDPAGVLDVLRRLDPGIRVDGTADAWRSATVAVKRGLFRKPLRLRVSHDPDYYAEDGWPRQLSGMQGYFSRFPLGDRAERMARTIASFRFALATFFEPDRSATGYDDDPRMEFIRRLARHLDGVIFTPSGLRDAAGRKLVAADGKVDPAAAFPRVPPLTTRTESAGGSGTAAERAEAGNEPEPTPPTAERVARRCLALAAVGARGLLEQEDPTDPGVEETRQRLIQWIEEIGIRDELEPDEWKALQRPHRKLSRQDALDATWRIEGLGVLAWALNRHPPLPIDELMQPGKLLPAVGLLNADRAKALLAEPPLRPADEIRRSADQIFAVHWRLTNHRLKPEPMNFRKFAAAAWFGPLNIEGVRLVEDDLAIGDRPIASADPDRVSAASSAAMERHRAVNWLLGEEPIYSRVQTNT